jgi:hypothetical protein
LLPANFPDLDPLMDTIHVYGNLQTVYTHWHQILDMT